MARATIVAFGEVMLRLTPESDPLIRNTNTYHAYYGGSEANVLTCLAALGDQTQLITALPQNELGQATVKHLRSCNVGVKHIQYCDNRLGLYFLEEGMGERTSNVIYDRKESAVNTLKADDLDFDAIFQDCSIFHVSGISFAISPAAQALCFQCMKEAAMRHIPISFDFNYRRKLWSEEQASAIYRQIIAYASIVFASIRDLEDFLHVTPEEFFEYYPCRTLILRERTILNDTRHAVTITAYQRNNVSVCVTAPLNAEFNVRERVGTGDAFVGGVLHVMHKDPKALGSALQHGLACFILKHSVKGDALTLGKEEIMRFMHKTRNDIHR